MRLEITITPRDITLVKWSGHEIVWSASAPVEPTTIPPSTIAEVGSIAGVLGELLARVPAVAWPRPRVCVAIAEPFARVKVVRGVPPIRKRRELLTMVRLNAAQYVASASPVVITGANVMGVSEVQIGLVDLALVNAVTATVQRARLRMGTIVPMAARRHDPSSLDGDMKDGRDHRRGIARIVSFGRREPLALPYRENPARIQDTVSRTRLAIAAVALVISASWSLYIQVGRSRGRVAAATAEAARIAPAADSGAARLRGLAQMHRNIAAAAVYSRQRISVSILLGALTDALPADAAMTTVRVDTAVVDVVTLAPRTAAVVEAFTEVPGVEAPAIIGPVSREMVGGRPLERATIRMRLVRAGARGTTDFAVERDDGAQ